MQKLDRNQQSFRFNFLTQHIVFIPSSKVECWGIAYAEPDISEEELMYKSESTFLIIKVQGIKKRFNNELINTNLIKIFYVLDKLPDYVHFYFGSNFVEDTFFPVRQ